MKRQEMIKKNTDFNDIIKTGKYIKSKYYNIYYKDGFNKYPMFGLAVSKKCGNAVEKNKIKRRLRMIIDNHKKMFKNTYNYIIMVKRDIISLSYEVMEDELIKSLERGNNEKNKD